MLGNGNGSTHHHSDAVIDKLVAAGLIQDADRADPAAVETALRSILDKFAAPSPGRPLLNVLITPQVEVGALTHLLLGLLEVLIALDVLPPQAVAAAFVRARATAQAAYAPENLQVYLGHMAEVLDWGLRRHGASVLHYRGSGHNTVSGIEDVPLSTRHPPHLLFSEEHQSLAIADDGIGITA
jgi:hypothetical protein